MNKDLLKKIKEERDNTREFTAFLLGFGTAQEVRLDDDLEFETKSDFESFLRKRFSELVEE